ncbi:hypothetical protein Tco_0804415 [Tanacetum coccineum]|uniref:Integrase, catalytic region, zinc finger, CCHC-type, peptidase aspartic, catalytic n=1 Tax=Tanacetum coccineum TaxID=301880 RepID=A0ABQ5A854_9ASTR
MLLCNHEEARIELSAEQVTPDAVDNSGPNLDAEPLQKVQNDDDDYNVFANDRQRPEQPESVNDTYLADQGDTNITPDSSYISINKEEADQDDELAKEHDLLASLIEKLKCKIDDSKKRNKFLELSNKAQIDKLKCEIDESKNQNKLLKSSYKTLKETCKEITNVNKEISKEIDKYQKEIEKYRNVKHVKDVEHECAKAYGLLAEHKVNSEKLSRDYTQKIINLNQKISEMEKSFLHIKRPSPHFHMKKRPKRSFTKLFLKKSKSVNPRLYDIGLYNDNLALMLTSESDDMICLAQESQSKLKEMVADLKFFNSLEKEVESLQSQLETQRTQFSNEIDRLSREYYYVDHMNAMLSVYTKLDEFTDLQCDYLDQVKPTTSSDSIAKKDISKSRPVTKTNVSHRVNSITSVSRLWLKSTQLEDRVMHNNSQVKTKKEEDHRSNLKFSNNKVSVAACNDSLNAKTSNVNFVTKKPIVVPIRNREPKRAMNQSVATPHKKTVASECTILKPKSTFRKLYEHLIEIILFIINSGCSNHMTRNLKLLINFVDKFLGTAKFGNDQFAPILGYRDLV